MLEPRSLYKIILRCEKAGVTDCPNGPFESIAFKVDNIGQQRKGTSSENKIANIKVIDYIYNQLYTVYTCMSGNYNWHILAGFVSNYATQFFARH